VGKSTSIKVMGGILVPDSGVYEVMGYTPWKHRCGVQTAHTALVGRAVSFDLLRNIYKELES
jgi:ABC-2 type transport system ATP-binding protein